MRLCSILTAVVLSAVTLAAQDGRRVAVTVDDLPGSAFADRCNDEAVRAAHDRLLATITRAEVPAVGFVIEGGGCKQLSDGLLEDLLGRWLDAGMDLGNHTHSHPDFNTTPLEEYQRGIVRGETLIKRLLEARGRRLRYFRHPMLHTGSTESDKSGLAEYLAKRGYEVAPVSFDNSEWIYASVYADAKRRGDAALMEKIVDSYVEYMEETFVFFEGYSRKLFDREIAQILLVHVNGLNSDHFDKIIDILKRRGYAFTTLEEALKDPAYASEDGYVGRNGISWLLRWGRTRGLPPEAGPPEAEWVSKLFQAR
jgi:peptidoglycan/xylan/chitin deacetylase (PgdA/CDA1 family)